MPDREIARRLAGLRRLQQSMPPAPDDDAGWAREALRELIEVRGRLDLTIERLARED